MLTGLAISLEQMDDNQRFVFIASGLDNSILRQWAYTIDNEYISMLDNIEEMN